MFIVKNKSKQTIPVTIVKDNTYVPYMLMPYGRGSLITSESMTPNMQTLLKHKFISVVEE